VAFERGLYRSPDGQRRPLRTKDDRFRGFATNPPSFTPSKPFEIGKLVPADSVIVAFMLSKEGKVRLNCAS